jgi:hypothetical protein
MVMAKDPNALEVARAYHRAWSSSRYDEAGRCLADELEIDVPINSYPTKTSFLEAVKRTREMTSKLELLAEFGNEGEALLLYDMFLPFGILRVAEHFTVAGGQITKIRHVHDTAAVRAAMAEGAKPNASAHPSGSP